MVEVQSDIAGAMQLEERDGNSTVTVRVDFCVNLMWVLCESYVISIHLPFTSHS
ncbi:MAG: hypothetical protein MJ002_02710 [Paludibacteraceae bacterium]|nr:hypothetical protein [Paludibacteraceae bacterium]